MREELVKTRNYQRFIDLCNDLLAASYGTDLAAVTGKAGLGKTRAMQAFYSLENMRSVWVLYEEYDSFVELLRKIAFKLSGNKPHYKSECKNIIQDELARQRRLIMVDEADRASMKILNGIRNICDVCKTPILLIGEDRLSGKLSREDRLDGRVRNTLAFELVSQPDVVLFYRDNLDLALSPRQAAALTRHSNGSFRRVKNDALKLEGLLKTNSLTTVTDGIVEVVMKSNREKSDK